MGAAELFADQNQNARDERNHSQHDCSDADMKERSDSDENQINREQQHSNVFGDHVPVLKQTAWLCTQKRTAAVGCNVDFTRKKIPLFLFCRRGNQDRFAHAV